MIRILLIGILILLVLPTAQAQEVSQWEANLDALITELPQRHVDPFTVISEAEFLAAAEALRADLPTLTDAQVRVRLLALVAMLGDAHTTLFYPITEAFFPVGLLVLDGGIYAVAGYPEIQSAFGARLVSLNNQPIEEVIAQVATLIPHENESWLNAQLPNFLVRSELLLGLGLIEHMQAVPWTFETADGEQITLEIAPAATIDRTRLISARTSQPRTEDSNGYYWFELFEDGTLYFKYNQAVDAADLPMPQFIEMVLNALAEQPVDRLVIDVRNNSGGNSMLLDPLITALADHPINTPGTLFVIIGPRTYSSAVLNAVRLAQTTEVVLVGLPTGGAPNHFGEIQQFELPYFDMGVVYSTNYFELLPGEPGTTLLPDVPVTWTVEDYLAGVDPFYQAVLAYQP